MKNHLLLTLLLCLFFSSIKPMRSDKDWSDFKNLPTEMKFAILDQLLKDPSLITIINSLRAIQFVDKEFYDIVTQEENYVNKYKRVFDYEKELNTILSSIKNVFQLINFINQNQNLILHYNDLAKYIHTNKNFSYLPVNAIQTILDLSNPESVSKFKNSIININQEFKNALENQDVAKVAALLIAGANPNLAFYISPNPEAKSALIHAVEQNNYAIVKLLLDGGANPDKEITSSRWLSPLSIAIKSQNMPIIEALLEQGADPNDLIYRGKATSSDNALELALKAQNISLLKLLIKYGAHLNVALSNGFIPLLNAAYLKNKEIVHLLLDAGAIIKSDFLQQELEDIRGNPWLTAQEQAKWLEAYNFLKHIIDEYLQEKETSALESVGTLLK